MAKRAAPRNDWLAWSLLAAGLLFALCLLSHEPPREVARTPQPSSAIPSPPSNVLGTPGDWLATHLFNFLGAGVYVLLACWFVLIVILLMPKKRRKWLKRLAGWMILLPWIATVAELTSTPTLLGFHFDGGAVGRWICAALETHFPLSGRLLVLGAWALAGVMLALDSLVYSLGRRMRDLSKLAIKKLAERLEPDDAPPRKVKAIVAELKLADVGENEAEEPNDRVDSEASSPGESSDAADTEDIPISRPQPIAVEEHALASQELLPVVRNPEAAEEEAAFKNFELPPLTLLEDPRPFPYEDHDQKLREVAQLLEKTFKDFDLNVRVVGINTGPVITQYEISLETGLRLNKVTSLADDLALNLKVAAVRVVAPIPGKNTVGIEVPNEHRADVRLKEVLLTAGKKRFDAHIPLFLGKDSEGRSLVYDLAAMPHLLIAGRTGTGKSVCMNAIILSILTTRRPDEVKMIMIDPKIIELSEYGKIPHLMHPVVGDMKKAEAILAWAVDKMEERYDLLSRARVRNLAGYNELGRDEILKRVRPDADEASRIPDKMPFIVIFVDEIGDLMMTMKREVETHIIRLAQKSRAAGIHLVVATQKPTVDVITGLIKSNLPARICFQVSSRSDSRVVLDEMGAEKLLGRGDMLFLQPGTSSILRAQGTYASNEEIAAVVEHLECDQPNYAPELVELKTSAEMNSTMDKLKSRDDLYEAATDIVVREGRGSVSLLQRTLGIGYGRAARLIDFMAEDGIVGTYNGSNARDVLLTPDEWRAMRGQAAEV